MPRLMNHAIDIINNELITGWCYSRILKKRPVALLVFLDDRPVGEFTADEYRKDLVELGVHPTGRCGFTCHLSLDIDLYAFKRLILRAKGRRKPLMQCSTSEIPKIAGTDLPRIVFMHIPKTAGTSFNTYARQFFPREKSIIHIESLDENQRMEISQQCNYIAGHLSLGKLLPILPVEQYSFYTIMREPYRHLHSHLNWLRGIGDKEKRGFFKKHPKVIQELSLKLNEDRGDIARILRRLVNHLDGFEIDFFDNLQTRYFLKHRPDKIGPAEIETAKENCAAFREIGLTESYDDFTRAFCRNNNFCYGEQPLPLNRSVCKPLYDYNSPEFHDIVHPLVKADLELYTYVKRTFRERER